MVVICQDCPQFLHQTWSFQITIVDCAVRIIILWTAVHIDSDMGLVVALAEYQMMVLPALWYKLTS